MKQKIKVRDYNGNVIEGELTVPNKMHFEVQRKTRANVFRDKTKYTRKQKYKNKKFDD